MAVRNAFYWSKPLRDDILAARYHLVESRPLDGPEHRLVVPHGWAHLSPVPQPEDPDAPRVLSMFLEDAPDRPSTIVVGTFPIDLAFFAVEVATKIARWMQMELTDQDPTGQIDLRATAENEQEIAYLAIAHVEEQWVCQVSSVAKERQPIVDTDLQVAWMTYQVKFEDDL